MSPPPFFAFSQLPTFKSTFLFLKKSHCFSVFFSPLLLLFYPILLFHSRQEIIIFTKFTYCPLLLTLQAPLQLLQLCSFSVRIIIKTLYVTAEREAGKHEIHNQIFQEQNKTEQSRTEKNKTEQQKTRNWQHIITPNTYFSSNLGFSCLIGSGFCFRIWSGSLEAWCSSLLFLIKSMTSWKISRNRAGKPDFSRICCIRVEIGMKISGKERSSSCMITKPLRHSATDRSTPALTENVRGLEEQLPVFNHEARKTRCSLEIIR